MPVAVYTVLDSWRWTENLSETCRVLFEKYIWEISASSWFYYKNTSRCTVLWMSVMMSSCCLIMYIIVQPTGLRTNWLPFAGRWSKMWNRASLYWQAILTLILLMWRIGWAPNNTSKWQMGFNSALKGLTFNPLNAELNPTCHLLALLGTHPILHISRIRVKNCASYI